MVVHVDVAAAARRAANVAAQDWVNTIDETPDDVDRFGEIHTSLLAELSTIYAPTDADDEDVVLAAEQEMARLAANAPYAATAYFTYRQVAADAEAIDSLLTPLPPAEECPGLSGDNAVFATAYVTVIREAVRSVRNELSGCAAGRELLQLTSWEARAAHQKRDREIWRRRRDEPQWRTPEEFLAAWTPDDLRHLPEREAAKQFSRRMRAIRASVPPTAALDALCMVGVNVRDWLLLADIAAAALDDGSGYCSVDSLTEQDQLLLGATGMPAIPYYGMTGNRAERRDSPPPQCLVDRGGILQLRRRLADAGGQCIAQFSFTPSMKDQAKFATLTAVSGMTLLNPDGRLPFYRLFHAVARPVLRKCFPHGFPVDPAARQSAQPR